MKTLCVLFGGVSSEHEVSCRSAASVLDNIDRNKYKLATLGITKGGRWLLYSGPTGLIPSGEWESSGMTVPAVISPDCGHGGLLVLEDKGAYSLKIDVFFGVLHGKNGEDGTVQGLMDLAGIPYVGSGVLSSAVCMDKAVAHALLTQAGIPKAKLVVVRRGEENDMAALEKKLAGALGYPMFVKPANSGSSVGVSRVTAPEGLPGALALAFGHDKKLVVEREIKGREIECSVIGNEEPLAAAVLGEIAPTAGFYDYDAKYNDDTAKLYIPADLDDAVIQEIRGMAVRAYQVLCCEGFARVDFFLKEDGGIILNEINTIPGFTSISMFPKMFEAAGMPYGELISKMIDYAVNR